MVPDSTNVPSPVDRTSDSKIATPSPVGSTVAWTSPARSSVRSTWLVADVLARRLPRSEEHTSELQSQSNLVCRLLLEKKKKNYTTLRRCRTPAVYYR